MCLFKLTSLVLLFSIEFCFSQVDSSFCEHLSQENLSSEKILEILASIEKFTEEERHQVFEKCKIYLFAENIIKSNKLKDEQKLDYYLRIQPLFPNNAEMGSVLGYDTIKLFLKYTSRPLGEIVESIKDKKLKKRAKDALIDADLLEE